MGECLKFIYSYSKNSEALRNSTNFREIDDCYLMIKMLF